MLYLSSVATYLLRLSYYFLRSGLCLNLAALNKITRNNSADSSNSPKENTTMTPKQQRMSFVCLLIVGATFASILIVKAIQENAWYFYMPSDIAAGQAPLQAKIRVGGRVKTDSVQRQSGLKLQFVLQDCEHSVTVRYEGILPDLFREGQSIIAHGRLNSASLLIADEVLAKHDENYVPPELQEQFKDGELDCGKQNTIN